jgi:hypothetical protein
LKLIISIILKCKIKNHVRIDEKQIINTVYIDNTSHNGTILEIQNNTIKNIKIKLLHNHEVVNSEDEHVVVKDNN